MAKKTSTSILSAASNSPLGKVTKGIGSFLLGPSLFLAGAICATFTKVTAEVTNAALSKWLTGAFGTSSLFSNNPFLTSLSSASDDVMKGSLTALSYFYRKGLVSMAKEFEEYTNHEGFGNTSTSGESNDYRDIEAMAQEDGDNHKTKERLEKMLKAWNKIDKSKLSALEEAVDQLESWVSKVESLPEKITGKTDEEKLEEFLKIMKEFETETMANPNLAALIDISNEAGRLAMQEVDKKIEGKTATEKDIISAYKALVDSIPSAIVQEPRAKAVGPQSQAKTPPAA